MKLLSILYVAFLFGCANPEDAAVGFEEPITAEFAGPIDFALDDVNAEGHPSYASADRAVPIMLDFYFNSCPACNTNAPNVEAAVDEFHGEAGQVLQITIDCEQDQWDSWIRRHRVTSPVLNDCARQLATRLGVRSYPTTIVLKADHTVAYRYVGVWSAAAKARIRREMGGR